MPSLAGGGITIRARSGPDEEGRWLWSARQNRNGVRTERGLGWLTHQEAVAALELLTVDAPPPPPSKVHHVLARRYFLEAMTAARAQVHAALGHAESVDDAAHHWAAAELAGILQHLHDLDVRYGRQGSQLGSRAEVADDG